MGTLIVFEGRNGAGKSTLARALTESLARRGVQCEYMMFPGSEGDGLGRWVYEFHHGPNAAVTDPTALQLLHVAAHIDGVHRRILPALNAGSVVVLDRYWWSTWVYGALMGADQSSLRRMIALEKLHWGGVRPSRLFLVNRPGADRRQLVEEQEYDRLAEVADDPGAVRRLINDRGIEDVVKEIIRDLDDHTELSRPGLAHDAESGTMVTASRPTIFSKLTPAKPTVVYDTYWKFAAERQQIFFRRLAQDRPPWTNDAILRAYKFTNAYRASDRVSQYLIRRVIYAGAQTTREIFFRTILFKLFNKIETWELLETACGEIRADQYAVQHYDDILAAAMRAGRAIYSGAYIMPSGGTLARGGKHRMHLELLDRMLRDHLAERLSEAASMREVFEHLVAYPTIGPFLAYQYATDLNYSVMMNFSEMEFVVPGPGARDGMRKCFSDLGGLSEADMIRVVTESQEVEFDRRDLEFKTLWGRPLQLIDCQNVFCEVDKYSRLRHPEIPGRTGRTRIKQRFRPTKESLTVWYPPKWGINGVSSVTHV